MKTTDELRLSFIGDNISDVNDVEWGQRWPVVDKATLKIIDVLEASDDLSNYLLADILGGKLTIYNGASDVLILKEN
ncbi:MAG: hypothetical protein WDA06_02970 [Phenylobacterium sp.]